jgi:hypothetical protein
MRRPGHNEKDFANLPEEWRPRAYCLRIGLEIEEGEELVKAVSGKTGNGPIG